MKFAEFALIITAGLPASGRKARSMPSEVVQLKLDCADLDESELQALTRDLAASLTEERVAEASALVEKAAPRQKGDVVTIGVIVLTLIQTGGVAAKLLEVLKVFIERKSTLHFELSRADGKKISFDSTWFGSARLESTQKLLAQFCKD